MLDSLIELLWYILILTILLILWRALNLDAIPQMINNLEQGIQTEITDENRD